MISPSMPMTSEMWVTRRVPSRRRLRCTTRSSADATCSRMARIGNSMPAIIVIVSIRDSVSRGPFEWTVVIDPS